MLIHGCCIVHHVLFELFVAPYAANSLSLTNQLYKKGSGAVNWLAFNHIGLSSDLELCFWEYHTFLQLL